jgi:hypothetical protein
MSANQMNHARKEIMASLERFNGKWRHPDSSRTALALAHKHKDEEENLVVVLKWMRQNMSIEEKEHVFQKFCGNNIYKNRIMRIKLGLPVDPWP